MRLREISSDLGRHVFGLGLLALGVVALAIGDFLPGQAAPKDLPARAALAVVAAAIMLGAGAGLQWRRTAGWAAATVAAYFGVVVCGLMGVRVIIRHYAEYLAYGNFAEQLALAAAGLVAWAVLSPRAQAGPARRIGCIAFGACAVLFGVAHFVYMNLTAPLVPTWLPPSQVFWGYATGVAHIAGGLGIMTGIQARLAAILLTVMYAAFTPLVHLPIILAHPLDHGTWGENAINVALAGAAWVVADSLAPRGRT